MCISEDDFQNIENGQDVIIQMGSGINNQLTVQ